MKLFKIFQRCTSTPEEVLPPEVVRPKTDDLFLIASVFPDRSAGRWCGFCGQAGNHHTERHEEFLSAAKAERA